jgi:hypothetical protein
VVVREGRVALVAVADGASVEAGMVVNVGVDVAVGLEVGCCVPVDSMDATDTSPTKGTGDREVAQPASRKAIVSNRYLQRVCFKSVTLLIILSQPKP